jgi:hypothetical protein
MSWHSR